MVVHLPLAGTCRSAGEQATLRGAPQPAQTHPCNVARLTTSRNTTRNPLDEPLDKVEPTPCTAGVWQRAGGGKEGRNCSPLTMGEGRTGGVGGAVSEMDRGRGWSIWGAGGAGRKRQGEGRQKGVHSPTPRQPHHAPSCSASFRWERKGTEKEGDGCVAQKGGRAISLACALSRSPR